MFIDDLRKSFLQQAIQGKLVEQNWNDEPASELLKRIAEEKEKLIKEGKVKREKLSPITEEEKPFEIPTNWVFVRVKDVCFFGSGEKMSGKKYPYLEAKYLRGKQEGKIYEEGNFVTKGSCLILVDGENSGELFDLNEDGYLGSTFKVFNVYQSIYPEYLQNFLLLKKSTFRNNKTGAAIPHLNKDLFFNSILPLPPLEEQKRIVAKLDELMLLLDDAKPLEEEIINLEKEFPGKLRQAILQYAIQGKLVQQNNSDEPASELLRKIKEEKEKLVKEGKVKKEKPLAPITDEEKPFEIPSNWEWVRIGSVLREVIVPQRDKPPFSEYGIPWCRIEDRDGIFLNGSKSNQLVSEKTIAEKNLKVYPIGTVLSACTGGSIGTIVINTVECCTNQTFNGLVCSSGLFNWYLFWFLTSKFTKLRNTGSGTTIPYISQDKTRQMVMPLPPLEEQKRIVAKLDELMKLCDELEEQINLS